MQLSEVKAAMRENTAVEWDGGEYYIRACILWLKNNEFRYSLRLCEAKNECHIAVVDLSRVNLVKLKK